MCLFSYSYFKLLVNLFSHWYPWKYLILIYSILYRLERCSNGAEGKLWLFLICKFHQLTALITVSIKVFEKSKVLYSRTAKTMKWKGKKREEKENIYFWWCSSYNSNFEKQLAFKFAVKNIWDWSSSSVVEHLLSVKEGPRFSPGTLKSYCQSV